MKFGIRTGILLGHVYPYKKRHY